MPDGYPTRRQWFVLIGFGLPLGFLAVFVNEWFALPLAALVIYVGIRGWE